MSEYGSILETIYLSLNLHNGDASVAVARLARNDNGVP